MTARDFAFWLQGYFELKGPVTGLDGQQEQMVRKHLALVFAHEIDPSFPNQEKLNEVHSSPTPTSGSVSASIDNMIVRC